MNFYPTFNGVLAQDENIGVLSIINERAMHIVEKQNLKKKNIQHPKIPFLRGLEFLFFGTYLFFYSLLLGLSKQPQNKMISTVSERLNISKQSVFITIVSFLSFFVSLFLFGFIPAKVSLIFARLSINTFIKNLILAFIKVFIFLLVLFCFKNISGINRMLSFNSASNVVLNKNENILLLKNHRATNYLNFIVSGFIFNFFFITLVGIQTMPLLKHLINTLLFLIGFSIVFELNFYLEKSRIRGIIIISSFFVTAKNNSTCELIASTAFWEMNLLKENDLRKLNEDEDGEQSQVFVSQILALVNNKLKDAGIDDPDEGKWLVAMVLDKKKNDLKFITTIKKSQELRIKKVLERRLKGEPLDKIFGKCEFFSLPIKVSKYVLSPRPETEILVEKCLEILQRFSKPNVLDLCTGSGAIALAIKFKNNNANVFASDVSEKALEVAKQNAKENSLKINLKKSDMFFGLNKRKKYDMIICNPPYIKSKDIPHLDKEVKYYDPIIALDGGEDGLKFYKIIAKQAPDYLKKNGILALEIGEGQGKSVKKLLSQSFVDVEIHQDYSFKDRFVFAKLK